MVSPEPTSVPGDDQDSNRATAYKGTRPGGRSARVRDAVLAATAGELAEVGFAELSLGRVAARAGVAPTTVHRRWGTRAALVADLLDEHALTAVPDPHRDSLADDLHAFALGVATALTTPAVQMMLRSMYALPPEDLAPIQAQYWRMRIELAQTIVDRAIDRGEVPEGTVGWDIFERLLAPIWMRALITGLPLDADTLDRIVAGALERAHASA